MAPEDHLKTDFQRDWGEQDGAEVISTIVEREPSRVSACRKREGRKTHRLIPGKLAKQRFRAWFPETQLKS